MNRYSASGWKGGGRGGKAHFHEHRTIRPSIYKLSFQRQKKKKKKPWTSNSKALYWNISAPESRAKLTLGMQYNTCCYGLCKHEAEGEMYLPKWKRLKRTVLRWAGAHHVTSRNSQHTHTHAGNMPRMWHTLRPLFSHLLQNINVFLRTLFGLACHMLAWSMENLYTAKNKKSGWGG